MRHFMIIPAAAMAVAACYPSMAHSQAIIASSGFNDQAGIYSNSTPGTPFTFGQTVRGRGEGEPGWAGTWQVSDSGGPGGADLAKAQTSAAHEGDGGLSIVPGSPETWVFRQLATLQTGQFVIEQDVNFIAAGTLQSRPFYLAGVQTTNMGPVWRITGTANNRRFLVMDGDSQGSGTFEETGILQKPGKWQHVVVNVNVTTQTWSFSVDGQAYAPPDPLNFRGSPPGIDVIEYLTDTSGSIDSVVVHTPDPAEAWRSADVNGDGRISVSDLGILATHFNNLPQPAGLRGGDINLDGVVNISDLGLLATYFGQPRAAGATATNDLEFEQGLAAYPDLASSVPEPSTLGALAITVAPILRRRRAKA